LFFFSQASKPSTDAPVGRIGDVGADDQAARGRGRRFQVSGLAPTIADVREGEGDDLTA